VRFIALRLLRRMAALVWVGVCVLVVSAVDAAAARAQVSPPATEPTAPAKLCAVVVPAAAIDVDDVVADHLTQALVDGAASEGHAVLGAEATDRALASVMMPYPPASADLWRATPGRELRARALRPGLGERRQIRARGFRGEPRRNGPVPWAGDGDGNEL
jgi:hypothetical protein